MSILVNNKSPLLAGLLSWIIPGLGQAYNGQIVKGIIIFALTVVIWFICSQIHAIWLLIFGLYVTPLIIEIILSLLSPFILINIIAAYDAMNKAKKYNKGEEIGDLFKKRPNTNN